MSFGLTRVHVRGFRSARDVAFAPSSLCALLGEAKAGKSNLLAAIHALLDPDAPLPRRKDVTAGQCGSIRIEGLLAGGESLFFEARPPERPTAARGGAPPVLFFPAALRSGALIAASPHAPRPVRRGARLLTAALAEQMGPRESASSAATSAVALVNAIASCRELGVSHLVLLLEEPELYLRPQAQRYLYRLLRALASEGCQVIYSTHSPAFLNVARLEEIVLVEHDPLLGTKVVQPEALAAADEFRALSEFDAERSELFLARAALIVEGRTEKLVFPFVFRALGYDIDREGISIIDSGGKSNIPLFVRISKAIGVPFVAVHDRDAPPGQEPDAAERALNQLIAEVAGSERTVVLEPDFEAVAGLRGHSNKPERAWRHFGSLAPPQVPEPLAHAAKLALACTGS